MMERIISLDQMIEDAEKELKRDQLMLEHYKNDKVFQEYIKEVEDQIKEDEAWLESLKMRKLSK